MTGPVAAYLDGGPDGRLHLQHGPIDLVIGVGDGASAAERPQRALAFEAARARFTGLLEELVGELGLIKSPARPNGLLPVGRTARRMAEAVLPFAGDHFITPMAAVAGAVADEMLDAMLAVFAGRPAPARAYVNNGGDIALHLAGGARFDVGIARDDGAGLGRFRLGAGDGIGGVATSGRGGRSLSMGIADAVTVLAPTAAMADAAATIIGNAVDLPGHPAVVRRPASELVADSDLGDRLVVAACGRLAEEEVAAALDAGAAMADRLIARGLVRRAALFLGPAGRVVAPPH